MPHNVYQIGYTDLAWALVPVGLVLAVFRRWAIAVTTPLHGLARMIIQLILIGYALNFIFGSHSAPLVCAILAVMLTAAGYIALRPVRGRPGLYRHTLTAISGGGLFTLVIVAGPVLDLTPWYEPRYLIPLAGMIFATAMNAVSLAAERFYAERDQGIPLAAARSTALKAALIPITNSLFAVGLVSLPGMMTGQILSGVSPLIAVRYQIMVMCMVYGASGLASSIFLALVTRGEDTN